MLISNIYKVTEASGKKKPSPKALKISERIRKEMLERERLLKLVRAHGFPQCSVNARLSRMRRYLKEHKVPF